MADICIVRIMSCSFLVNSQGVCRKAFKRVDFYFLNFLHMEKQELVSLSFDRMSNMIGGEQHPTPGQPDHSTKCLLSVFGAGAMGYLTGVGLGGGIYSVLGSFGGMATAAAAGCF